MSSRISSRISSALLSALVIALVVACPPTPTTNGREGEGEGEGEPNDLAALIDAEFAYDERCLDGVSAFGKQSEPVLLRRELELLHAELRGAYLEVYARVTLDIAAASACIAALADAPCDQPPTACGALFTGSRAEGAGCLVQDECVDDVACYGANGLSACGTCTARAGEGESCAAAYCAADLDCVDDQCVPEVDEPDEPDSAVGDPCDPDLDECFAPDDTFMTCSTGQCAFVTVVEPGDTCDITPIGELPLRYCVDQTTRNRCAPSVADPSVGTCVARAAIGDPCDVDNPCRKDEAVCADDGRCRAGGVTRAACVDGRQCQAGYVCPDDTDTCASMFAGLIGDVAVCE